jgi:endonuclease YncB( thermonuclease family)
MENLYPGRAWPALASPGSAVELEQPFDEQAKRCTEALACGKPVTVIAMYTDRCGRVVGVVILPDGGLLGLQVVSGAGLAWWYRTFSESDRVAGGGLNGRYSMERWPL